MAMEKNIPTNIGIDASYWRVLEIRYTSGVEVFITLAGYVSKEARTEGKSPIMPRTYQPSYEDYLKYFTPEEISGDNINIISQCYKYIMENDPSFTDAVQV